MIPLVLALLLLQEPQAVDKKWTVKGSVVNALTGELLRKATVTLKGRASYSATTDAGGKFSLEGTQADEFEIHAARHGFIDFYEARKLKISGDAKKDLTIKMTPQCVLAGHVFDEDGDPVENADVFIVRRIAGRDIFSQSENTDNEGHFAVTGLQAGSYIVSAADPGAEQAEAWRPHPRMDYVRTYYPNGIGAEAAVPVLLAAGTENRTLDIRLRKERVFHVRGHITNLPKLFGSILLVSRDAAKHQPEIQAQIHEGKFEFTGILPGDYVVLMSPGAFNPENRQFVNSTMFCRIPLAVGDRDIDDLTIDLAPGATITGSIKMEGSAKLPEKWPLLYMVGQGEVRTMSVKEDGTFTWSDVPPDTYEIKLAQTDGIYLKTVRFNGQPASMTAWDLTSSAAGTLEVILSPNAAQISGVVRDKDGVPVADKRVTVWRPGDAARSVPSNADGSFLFGSLAPGEYKVLAWEEIEYDWSVAPEFISRFEASQVKVQEGSKQSIDLTMLPKKLIDEEVAKLQ